MSIGKITNPIDIAISGLKAQNRSIQAISSNVANARTTDAGNGMPYRRLEAILRAADDGVTGVEADEISEDMSDFTMVLSPGHPQANANGYLAMPNVDIANEIMNLNLASRAYQANAAVLKRYQAMANTSLELLK
ncbi:MAG: flagellar basal body rod protein FlgC [Phycisphaerae bacterium]|nr:flagellar basal body rod protein FlgC [Phycisphaerae bacterium]